MRDAAGAPVTQEAVERLRAALGDGFEVSVERGVHPRRPHRGRCPCWGLRPASILVITLTSTALTVAEQQSDQATLAALGATGAPGDSWPGPPLSCSPRSGACSGSRSASSRHCDLTSAHQRRGGIPSTVFEGQETILVIPWLSLLIVGVLVPRGAIAWAGIRKAPQITRRST